MTSNFVYSIKCLLYILIGTLFFAYPAHALNYAKYFFSYSPESAPNCIEIVLQTNADDQGNSVIKIPEKVNSFIVKNVEAKLYTVDKLNKLVLIQQKPNEEVELSYQSCFNNPSKVLKQAIYEKELFFIEHSKMLVFPLGKEIGDKWHYIMDYTKLPKEFSFIGSYPIQDQRMDSVDSFFNFTKGATLAGKFESKKIHLNQKTNQTIHYATIGKWDWLNKNSENYIKALLTHQRNFWQDDDFPDYTIALAESLQTSSSNGIQGLHFKNFMTLSITPNKNNLHTSIISLSHEMFHGWIGHKAHFKNPTESIAWFVEGFTDYYGLRFALESGLLCLKDYTRYHNTNLVKYYSSPIKHLSEKQRSKHYQNDNVFYAFSLLKGAFIAQKMSSLKDAQKTQLIDTITKQIYLKIKEHKNASEEDQELIVLQAFKKILGENQWEKYHNLIKLNHLLSLTGKDFGHSLKMKPKVFKLPNYHFDMAHFMMHKTIKDLDSNSPEYQAGLREGMRVVNHNLTFHRAAQSVLIVVLENNIEKNILFCPSLKNQVIPQLT